MRNECNIIRDLLPLYVEQMVSTDTAEYVEEHLKGCRECLQEYEQMKEPQANQTKEDAAPLVTLKRKLWKKRMQTVFCTGLFAIALLVSAFAFLSAPVYFPYTEDLFIITENADESITITFDEKVTDYRCVEDVHIVPEEVSSERAQSYYRIETWTTLWNQWFAKRGVQATTIPAEEAEQLSVYYISNSSTEDICIYGQPITSGGVISLPRLVLNNYFFLALLCVIVLFVLWCIVRRNATAKAWIERILLYPISYCIGHVMVKGFRSSSYSAPRDFMLIVFLSILLYGGLLLARSVYGLHKEIRELNG